MEVKLQLCVFVQLIQVSLAVWQHMTVMKGQTITLSCPVTDAHKSNVDWKNPEGFVMFFDTKKALKDKRYSIIKLSNSEFTISISNATFSDGGNYTCLQYSLRPVEKKVEVTVLDRPKMNKVKNNGTFSIKCTAEGNHHTPQISWKLDDGPEIHYLFQVLREGKKIVSTAILDVQNLDKKHVVMCLVRHPALPSQPLKNFVKIGRNRPKPLYTTTTTAQPQRSTHGRTSVYFTTKNINGHSSESFEKLTSTPTSQTKTSAAPAGHITFTGSYLVTSETSTLSDSTALINDTRSNETSTAGWKPVSETTEGISLFNSTEGNITGVINDPRIQTGREGSSSLLVFLVSCLIFCLLVVVIFFAIKLRRAHMIWKRENEESDPSEESNKSKSSQEEKNSQAQRRKGLFNTAFAHYVVEDPTTITSVNNTGAMAATTSVNKGQPPLPQTTSQTSATCTIKETEL